MLRFLLLVALVREIFACVSLAEVDCCFKDLLSQKYIECLISQFVDIDLVVSPDMSHYHDDNLVSSAVNVYHVSIFPFP